MAVDDSARGLYTQDENLWHSNYEGGQLEDLEWEPGEGVYEWTEALADTPTLPEYVEIEFINGMPKRFNGHAIGNVALIEALNAIGGTHGVGRVEFVENRLIGMKSRAIDETPGGMILRVAHQALEEITLDRETANYKRMVALKYADLVYNGQWFTPLRDALQAFVTVTQRDVTGSVRVRLHRGHAVAVQRKAAYSLYREDLATFNNDEVYNHKDAEGFIKFFTLSTRIKAQVDRQRAARVTPVDTRRSPSRE
jgi:argininosuccinate synthase